MTVELPGSWATVSDDCLYFANEAWRAAKLYVVMVGLSAPHGRVSFRSNSVVVSVMAKEWAGVVEATVDATGRTEWAFHPDGPIPVDVKKMSRGRFCLLCDLLDLPLKEGVK